MFRRTPLAAALLLLAAATVTHAAASLTAEQIADKNAAARGGLAAWKAVQTLTLEGKLDAGGTENHELPFVAKFQRPHKTRMEVVFNNQTSVQVFDGSQGWKVRPFLNRNEVEPYTPSELKSAQAEDDLDGPLIDYAAKGSKISVVGMEAVEGKPAYHLKLTNKAGVTRNIWVDANTFLEVKIDGEPRVLDGRPHPVEVYYREYQPEQGLMVPHLVETEVQGVKVNHKMHIAQVAVNARYDAAVFQKPTLAGPAGPISPIIPPQAAAEKAAANAAASAALSADKAAAAPKKP